MLLCGGLCLPCGGLGLLCGGVCLPCGGMSLLCGRFDPKSLNVGGREVGDLVALAV